MKRNLFAFALGCAFACAAALAILAAESPSFVVINIDDLGYADIGPFGSKLNRTPQPRWNGQGRAEADLLLCGAGVLALACGAHDRLISEARAQHSPRAFSRRCGGSEP